MKDNPLIGALASTALIGFLRQFDWFLMLFAPLILAMLGLTIVFVGWVIWRVLSQGLKHFWGAADGPPGS